MRHTARTPYNGCMNDTCRPAPEIDPSTTTRWSVGGLFLEALAQRDYARMSDCFEPEATMRALLPSGPAEFRGAAQIADNFRSWFGDAQEFEVLDGSVGEVGNRLHLAWRLRLRPTPWGDEHWHVIEQQAYVRAFVRIDGLDLLCSGFMPDDHR